MSSGGFPENGTEWPILRERMVQARAEDRPWYGPRMFIGGSYFGRDDLVREAALARHHGYRFDAWPAGRYETSATAGSRSAGGLASAWAVLRYLGEAGYLEIAGAILEARVRLTEGLRAIDGVEVRGEPDAYLVAFGCEDGDVFAVDEVLTAGGWTQNRLLDPPSLHLFLDGANRESIVAYLGDLAAAIDSVRRLGARAESAGASYAVPGAASGVEAPDR
jgi:hypothetical protein